MDDIVVRYPSSQEHETGHFVTKSSSDNNDLQRQKTYLQEPSLFWIKLNDITWKLTDGSKTRTHASHGQWGGYEIERGLAWVMDVGWIARKHVYFARCGNRSYGPTDFADAKQAAFAMAIGAPIEPVGEARSFIGQVFLNGTQAELLYPPRKT
jgi:hypothetical protein